MKRASIVDEKRVCKKRIMDVVEYDDGHLELEYKVKSEFIRIELCEFQRQLDIVLTGFTKMNKPEN